MYCIASQRVLSPLRKEERQRLLAQAHLQTLGEMLEAYPLFVIKDNEPTLQADLATYFADPYAQMPAGRND